MSSNLPTCEFFFLDFGSQNPYFPFCGDNWDHQLLQEMYVVKVKDKAQSKDKWDIFELVRAVPGPKGSLELIQPTEAENPCKMG